MRHLLRSIAPVFVIVFGGCSTTPLTVESDSEQVATIMGVPAAEIVFVSNGDVAVASEFTDFFKLSDAAVIALTDDALYWLHLDSTIEDEVQRIPAADIVTLARDVGCFQVQTDDELYLVRLRGWQRHAGDGIRMLDFMTHLLKANSGLFVADAEIVYQKPFNPGRLDKLNHENQSDPNIVHTQLSIPR